MKFLCLLFVVLVGVAMVESGVVRQLGNCARACIALYAPVCGSDGNTYSNTCVLEIAACEARASGDATITLADHNAC